jgi:hypothetical protein
LGSHGDFFRLSPFPFLPTNYANKHEFKKNSKFKTGQACLSPTQFNRYYRIKSHTQQQIIRASTYLLTFLPSHLRSFHPSHFTLHTSKRTVPSPLEKNLNIFYAEGNPSLSKKALFLCFAELTKRSNEDTSIYAL